MGLNPTLGYLPTAAGMPTPPPVPAAPRLPALPGAATVFGATTYRPASTLATGTTVTTQAISQNGPVLPTVLPVVLGAASRAYASGTQAAIGAAQAIALNTNATMARGVEQTLGTAAEPLLHLSWNLASNLGNFLMHAITFQWGTAAQDLGSLFTMGAVDTGAIFARAAQPFSLTAAVQGGTRSGLGQALATGLSMGVRAFKTSIVWAIPSALINAFLDYKYKDTNDPKRVFANFCGDMVGYTGAGMAGAAAGALIGSMTMPIIGTLVGAGVGIALGYLSDSTVKPLISNTVRDQLGT